MRTWALVASRDFQTLEPLTRAAYSSLQPHETFEWHDLLLLVESGRRQECFAAHQDIMVIGDFRLDERLELARSLHCDPQLSSPELVIAFYRAFGPGCVSRLRGEFAFVIADMERRTIVAAADRIASKPCYYAAHDTDLVFASHLSLVARHQKFPGRLDPAGAIAYIIEIDGNHDRTPLENIRRLPPSNMLEATPRHLRTSRYWTPRFGAVRVDPQEAAEEFRRLLVQAIRRRHVAGETALFLSGGLDSGAIAVLAAENGIDLKTYSLRFPGDHAADEGAQIALLLNKYGFIHHEIHYPDSLVPDRFPYSYRNSLLPADLFYFPTLHMHAPQLEAMERDGIRVAMSGLGGDHLLAPRVARVDDAVWFDHGGLQAVRRRFRRSSREAGLHPLQILRSELLSPSVPRLIRFVRRLARDEFVIRRRSLLRHKIWRLVTPGRFSRPGTLTSRRIAELVLATNALSLPAEQLSLLSESFGIDTRHPFLDSDLIEFVVTATPGSLFSLYETKAVLRRALRGLLPDPICERTGKAAFTQYVINDAVRTSAEVAALIRAFCSTGLLRPQLLENSVRNRDNGQRRQISRIANIQALWEATLSGRRTRDGDSHAS